MVVNIKSLRIFCVIGEGRPRLNWDTRRNIALGTAKAIQFLHMDNQNKPKIIHRDIKSENILLHDNFHPRV